MRFFVLLPVVLVAACATQGEPAATAADSAAARTPAASAASAPAPVPAAAGASKTGARDDLGTITADNIAEAQRQGYKVVNENGQSLLCRKQMASGTRLKYQTTCLTPEQWRMQANAAREGLTPAPVPAYTNGRP